MVQFESLKPKLDNDCMSISDKQFVRFNYILSRIFKKLCIHSHTMCHNSYNKYYFNWNNWYKYCHLNVDFNVN